MKQIVRYRYLTIPNKLTGEIRITVDDRAAEYSSAFDGGTSTNISLYPVISLNIVRPSETDSSGNKIKAVWNPNDSIGMTKYTFPIFVDELKEIKKDMKIPDLYVYRGDRLELNQQVAEKVRRVFKIGNVTIEFSAVIIVTNDQQVEGIKIKFNNEQSSVLLTLNELTALEHTLDHLDIDSIGFMMYLNYCNPTVKHGPITPHTDIIPPKKPVNNNIPKTIDPREFQD